MKKGLTLVEVLVSLVILSFVLAAIFTILNLQTVKSAQVQKTAILQTDAQVALTLLKWDLACIGLAYPKEQSVIQSFNGNATGTDSIRMRAAGFGFESGSTRWSWLLDNADGNIFTARSWPDTSYNFMPSDSIVLLDEFRYVLDPPGLLVVQSVSIDTFYDPYGVGFPAQRVTVDKSFTAGAGLVVIRKFASMFDREDLNSGLMLRVINNQLMRDSDVLLDNVEDLQFAYGIDTDGDTLIDSWSDDMPLLTDTHWAIRYTIVVASKPMGGFQYPLDSVSVEDHTYGLSTNAKRQKRTILSGTIYPPNLQP